MLRILTFCLSTIAIPLSLSAAEGKPSLKQALADLKTPPGWFATTKVDWDMSRPWSEGRLEIRRLLALDEASVQQAVKLTWLYKQKGDINDGHEWPMYLFMSGNYAWATVEYPKYLATVDGKGPTHAYLCYASSLAHFGEYAQATAVLDKAMNDLPPAPWRIRNIANIHDQYGDIYAEMGQIDKAKQAYAEAMRLLPTSNQPYGRHLLHRHAAKVKAKLDLLMFQSLATANLRDGTYRGTSLGYGEKDLIVTLTITNGRIADIQLKHFEKIDLGATKIIPQRIIEKQSLKVDGVTGATVTTQAIIEGTFEALKKAGLK